MSKSKGFTLIEMLIVLAIIGIILSIAYPSLAGAYNSSQENDRARNEYVVNKALKQYYALTGKYPAYNGDSKALSQELAKQTGVTLNTDYTYIYTLKNSEVISIQVTAGGNPFW